MKGRGSGVPRSAPRGGRGRGSERGARAWRGIARVAGIGPRSVGAGGVAVARQRRVAGRARRWREWRTGGTGRQRGLVGSGWVREGVRGSAVAWQGALTSGLGSIVPAHRVLNPIQTKSNYSKRFKRIQNCPNFG
jgi:hypothetical protein